jgi:hypothetical protein
MKDDFVKKSDSYIEKSFTSQILKSAGFFS